MQEQAAVRNPLDSAKAKLSRRMETPTPFARAPKPSDARADQERDRRYRERTIANWLRSLSR